MADKEDRDRPKYRYCQEVKLKAIELEGSTRDPELVYRIEIHTDKGKITFKPKKKVTKQEKIAGFVVKRRDKEMYRMSELLTEYPFLIKLNEKIAEKGSVKATVSYAYFTHVNEDGEEYEIPFMRRYQFENIFVEGITDKSNLESQQKWKAKNEDR